MQGHLPPTAGCPPSALVATFELAYRTWGTAVLRYALRRSSSREDALDVVAETFGIAWRRLADLPVEPDEVGPWLFGIARLCLANAARGTRRASRLGERLAASLPQTSVPDPATVHEGRADRQLVRAALGELSPEDRELVALIAWEGLTPAQAATALGLTAGTARVRLHRARTRLRKVLHTSALLEESTHDH